MVECLIENYQKDVGMICLNSSKEGINMYLHLVFKKKDNYLIYRNKLLLIFWFYNVFLCEKRIK